MSYSKIEKYALNSVAEIAKAKGYDIYDVEYEKEGPHWFLRIYIESENGVLLDDCEDISRLAGDVFDKDDVIKDNYFLEVSSPGLERSLRLDKHFDKAIGENILVRQKKGKTIEGKLLSHSFDNITLLTDEEVVVPKQNIKKTNVIFDFNS